MAKSIRSKHKRRMRAIKRVRYGKKELDRLKKTLGIVDISVKSDVEIEDESNVITFVHPEDLKKQQREKEVEEANTQPELPDGTLPEDMEISKAVGENVAKKGAYPVWMNQRQIRKIATARNKAKSKQGKKMKRLKRNK